MITVSYKEIMSTKMKIYIASSWKNAEMAYAVAIHLRKKNFDVDVFCDDTTGRYAFNWKEIVKDRNKLNSITFIRDYYLRIIKLIEPVIVIKL